MRRKLIVVSNRGPVSFSRGDDGERVARRGGGGLTTALRGLLSLHDVTWIASAISDEDRALAGAPLDETTRDGAPFRLRLVGHERQAYDRFYNVVANPMLWFVQHYLWELAYTPGIDGAFHTAWDGG
jgi:trehalose 6-phosphate synthase